MEDEKEFSSKVENQTERVSEMSSANRVERWDKVVRANCPIGQTASSAGPG